jgi:hypothetical protein
MGMGYGIADPTSAGSPSHTRREPMPELISPQWAQHLQDVLTHVGTAVLAAMGGWLTKHKQAQSQHSTLAE